MKRIILAGVAFVQLQGARATSNQANPEFDFGKREVLEFASAGVVRAKVARPADGRPRFVGFDSIAVKQNPKLRIYGLKHSLQKDASLEQLCKYAAVHQIPFRATLTLAANPFIGIEAAKDSTGREVEWNDFSNPVSLESPNVVLDQFRPKWAQYDVKRAVRGKLLENYARYLNDKIHSGHSHEVQIDLSDYNMLACDLAEGAMVLRSRISYRYQNEEPDVFYPLKLTEYNRIFTRFWQLRPEIESANLRKPDVDLAEAFVLGQAAAGQLQTPVGELLANAGRFKKIMNSVREVGSELSMAQRTTASGDQVSPYYEKTKEFVAPAKKDVRDVFLVDLRKPTVEMEQE